MRNSKKICCHQVQERHRVCFLSRACLALKEPSFLFFKILLNFAFMGILGAHLPHLESDWEYQPNPTHFPLAKVENTHPQSKGSEPGAAPQLSKVSSEPGMNRLVKDE